MVLSAANYLDNETLLNHLPWLTPEEVQMIMKRNNEQDMARLAAKAELEAEEQAEEEQAEEEAEESEEETEVEPEEEPEEEEEKAVG